MQSPIIAASEVTPEPQTSLLYDAVLAFLREYNWNVTTIGGVEVRRAPNRQAADQEIVIRFAGTVD